MVLAVSSPRGWPLSFRIPAHSCDDLAEDTVRELVAYVVAGAAGPLPDEQHRYLADQLPRQMRLAVIEQLAELPRLATGKPDRRRLARFVHLSKAVHLVRLVRLLALQRPASLHYLVAETDDTKVVGFACLNAPVDGEGDIQSNRSARRPARRRNRHCPAHPADRHFGRPRVQRSLPYVRADNLGACKLCEGTEFSVDGHRARLLPALKYRHSSDVPSPPEPCIGAPEEQPSIMKRRGGRSAFAFGHLSRMFYKKMCPRTSRRPQRHSAQHAEFHERSCLPAGAGNLAASGRPPVLDGCRSGRPRCMRLDELGQAFDETGASLGHLSLRARPTGAPALPSWQRVRSLRLPTVEPAILAVASTPAELA